MKLQYYIVESTVDIYEKKKHCIYIYIYILYIYNVKSNIYGTSFSKTKNIITVMVRRLVLNYLDIDKKYYRKQCNVVFGNQTNVILTSLFCLISY